MVGMRPMRFRTSIRALAISRRPMAYALWLESGGASPARRASTLTWLGRIGVGVLAALVTWRCMTLNAGTPLDLLARHAMLALLLPAAWAGLLGARDRQRFEQMLLRSWLASLPLAASMRLTIALLRSFTAIASRALLTVLALVLADWLAGESMTAGQRGALATLATGFVLGAAIGWMVGAPLKRRSHHARLHFARNTSSEVAPTASLQALGRWPGLDVRARGNAAGMAKTIGVILLIQPAAVPPPVALAALGGGVIAFLLVDAWRGLGMTLAAARRWLAPTPLTTARLARAMLPRALIWQLLACMATVILLVVSGVSPAVSISASLIWLIWWCATTAYECVRALPSRTEPHG